MSRGKIPFSFKVLHASTSSAKNNFLFSKIRFAAANSELSHLAFIAPSIGVCVILKKFNLRGGGEMPFSNTVGRSSIMNT